MKSVLISPLCNKSRLSMHHSSVIVMKNLAIFNAMNERAVAIYHAKLYDYTRSLYHAGNKFHTSLEV